MPMCVAHVCAIVREMYVKVVDQTMGLPVPTPLGNNVRDDTFMAQPRESSPALPTRLSSMVPTAEVEGEDRSNWSGDLTPEIDRHSSLSSSSQESNTTGVKVSASSFSSIAKPSPSGAKICPSLLSLDKAEAPTPPLTPPRESLPAFSSQPQSVEPPSIDLKAPTTPPPLPSTYSTNRLEQTFNTQLDKAHVVFVIEGTLCTPSVTNDRSHAKSVLSKLEDGYMQGTCQIHARYMQAECLASIIGGLTSAKGKRGLTQPLHGPDFVVPQWGVPKYKVG